MNRKPCLAAAAAGVLLGLASLTAAAGEVKGPPTSQTNTNDWAKSGLMFRDGETGSNGFVMLGVTPDHGLTFFWRKGEGSWCDVKGLNEHAAYTFPLWLKLEKSGQTFTALRSPDGEKWTVIVNCEIPSNFSNARVGLAVTSHNGDKLCATTFDRVEIKSK